MPMARPLARPLAHPFDGRDLRGGRPAPSHRWRALLVEDGLLNRQIARTLLERGDFHVATAENGAEALEALGGEEAFDIVLMDLDMPVMDGFEAAAAIRSLGDGRASVPIVALSALTQDDEVARARRAGIDGHLPKPFDPGTFVQEVKKWLAEAPAPQGEGEPARRPVWNRQPFDDLAARLGSARLGQALLLFEARLARAHAILRDPEVTAGQIAFEAHALVSGAGTLGFEELCAASDEAQRRAALCEPAPRGGSALGASVAALLAAIERALTHVSPAGIEPRPAPGGMS